MFLVIWIIYIRTPNKCFRKLRMLPGEVLLSHTSASLSISTDCTVSYTRAQYRGLLAFTNYRLLFMQDNNTAKVRSHKWFKSMKLLYSWLFNTQSMNYKYFISSLSREATLWHWQKWHRRCRSCRFLISSSVQFFYTMLLFRLNWRSGLAFACRWLNWCMIIYF